MSLQEMINKNMDNNYSYKETSSGFVDTLFRRDTYTENGAVSNSTTGDIFVDDFGKNGTYRDRSIEEVFHTMNTLANSNKELALKSIFYIRNISRKPILPNGNKLDVVSGQGNRDEAVKRLLWLAYYQPEVFYKNIWLYPIVGYWKDLFTLLTIDFENKIDKNKIFEIIKEGLQSKTQIDLVLKYLPRIESKPKSNRRKLLNIIAKQLSKYLGLSYKEYRKLKSGGKAHQWQQLVSNNRYDEIVFNTIGGKALLHLVTSGWVEKHGLENKYLEFLEQQKELNFNGYVYELTQKVNLYPRPIIDYTLNKQFKSLLTKAKTTNENVLCALDTSASMTWDSVNGVTSYDICIGLGIYFSSLNTGAFKDVVAMFSDTTTFLKLNGEFTDRIRQIKRANPAWGSTNFQSIIDAIVKRRLDYPEIPLEEYPTTILVVSDMQFNPTTGDINTNYEDAMKKLKSIGLKDMKIIWWNVTSQTKDYPSTIKDSGTYLIGGFDGNIISLLLNEDKKESKQKNMRELMIEAYNQELFNYLKI